MTGAAHMAGGTYDVTGAFLTLILAAIVALAMLAKRLRVPYPIVLVVGGLVLGLIPGVPTVTLEPDLVFLLFLPPLIFGDGWTTDIRSFWRYRTPILLLATGLVALTSICVAYAAHALIGLPLALGFVLGGILSPTDAVATDAIAEQVGFPKRLAAVIGGESLINDATGLVIYRFALIAVLTGTFSLLSASLLFVYAVGAGIAIGVGGAWLIARLMMLLRKRGLTDEVIAVSLSLVTPFALYVPADALGASGVLAALSGGMYMSRKSSKMWDADSRIAAASTWNLLFFVFNGAAFVLIGLQLRSITAAVRASGTSVGQAVAWSLAITAVLIAVRFAWVFAVANGRYRLFPQTMRAREGPPAKQSWLLVLSTAGMRGIVSLAAALALPETLGGGVPFPQRDLILFITFVVILVTLVGEGLLLPWLIRAFGVVDDADDGQVAALAKVRTAEAARERLRALEPTFTSPQQWEVAGRIDAGYEQRLTHFTAHLDGLGDADGDALQHEIERRMRREAYTAERRALFELRRSGEITDEVYRDIEWDIDLAESRLS